MNDLIIHYIARLYSRLILDPSEEEKDTENFVEGGLSFEESVLYTI